MSRPPLPFDDLQQSIAELRQKQMFFIGGSMKSGTTWLQLLLNQHPQVSCNGEGHFFNALAPALGKVFDGHDRFLEDKNLGQFSEIEGYRGFSEDHFLFMVATAVALFMTRQIKDKEVLAVGEKTPDNIRFLDQIDRLFPEAKVIHMVRDGRDCAISGWFHNLRVNTDWTLDHYPTLKDYVRSFAGEWAADLDRGMAFAEKASLRYHLVRYEDLSGEPVASLAEVLRFLGVEDSVPTLESCLAAASFEKLSGGRQKGEENPASFFRKGVSGDWRNHFTAEMEVLFAEKAGGWLTRLGYAPTGLPA